MPFGESYINSGTELVHYIYDAYGNITIDASSANMALAKINPYRYREYRYDNELSWYYLNSRYYNPQVGRFINADGLLGQVGDILSTNMFAYCANNPVMFIDNSGQSMESIIQWVFGISGILVVSDGPLPFGDIVAGSLIALTLTVAGIYYVATNWDTIQSTIRTTTLIVAATIVSTIGVYLGKATPKERSTEHPSYVNKGMIDKLLSAQQNATNMMNNKWGEGNWGKGPGSDFNQIVKWIVRGGLLKEILIKINNNNNNNNDDDEMNQSTIMSYDFFGGRWK